MKTFNTFLLITNAMLSTFLLTGCGLQNSSPWGDDFFENNRDTEISSGSDDNTVVNASDFSTTIAGAMENNCKSHADDQDYILDNSETVVVTLNKTAIDVTGDGATAEDGTVTITDAGTYRISGTLDDGQIIVDAPDDAVVRIILDGVSVHCATNAPLYIHSSEKTIIVLASATENVLSDGDSYEYTGDIDSACNAAVFSKCDLSISGDGSLRLQGNYRDGMTSKDGLVIESGTITVNAADDGIRGKDYLIINGGTITVDAGGDGLKSDNDSTKGFIYIESAEINCTTGGDAIAAETDVLIASGNFTLESTGTGQNTTSAKGIKGIVNTIISGGDFTITSTDDAIHANGNITVNDGTFSIASGDDAIHADSTITVNNGTITVSACYEGIESKSITVNGGMIHLSASDDGINGSDGSGGGMDMMRRGGTGGCRLTINGGYIAVTANGDGVDINGSVTMTDGTLIIHGPTSSANGFIDYDGTFTISGGLLLAAGSSGMLQAPGTSSSQYSLVVKFSSKRQANTIVNLQNSDGTEVFSFAPSKQFQALVYSSPMLKKGSTYTVYTGGNSRGTATDGLYDGGTYTPGTMYDEFTLSSVLTTVR